LRDVWHKVNRLAWPALGGKAAAMPDSDRPSLLVLDASYTLEMIRERGMENSVTCRDLDGFFRHVFSVHPFATLLTSESWSPRFGRSVWHEMALRHTFIEGKVGRFGWLKALFPVNFLIGQIGLFFSLWALIRREDVRVIRVGDPLYLGLFGLALKMVSGVPVLIRVNGNNDKVRKVWNRPMYPQLFRSTKIEKLVEKFTFRRFDYIAAPNRDNLAFAEANGADNSRMAVFSFGGLIAREHFQDPEARKSATDDFKALGVSAKHKMICVGRLIYPKFADHVIQTLHAVRKAGLDAVLIMVGDGEDRDALEALTLELAINDWVCFAGNRDQKWLARVLASCDLYVSPSTGRALAEAALAGLPTVGYDTDWQSELILTGGTGVLTAYRDKDAMAKGAIDLLKDDDHRQACSRRMRELAVQTLDPNKVLETEREVYSLLLKEFDRGNVNADS
jgi:glycosyltransferase involved in cell wall biosynthesis